MPLDAFSAHPYAACILVALGAYFRRFRIELLLLFAIGFVALSRGITQPPLLDWDEATYAEVARETVDRGSYLDFTWNGEQYLKKPPLLFWTLVVSFKSFGESETSTRLPSLIFGLATLFVVYLTASVAAGRTGGTLSSLLLLTFYFFIARGGRECATDAPLIFFNTLACYALLKSLGDRRWLALAGAACGLATLSKGMAGLLPLLVAIFAMIVVPAFRSLGISGLLVMLSSAVIVALPWYLYQSLFSFQRFFSIFIGRETIARLLTHTEADTAAARPTLLTLLSETRHLWPLLLPAFALSAARWSRRRLSRSASFLNDYCVGLWLVWLVVALAGAFVVQTKLSWYVLPGQIPLALLAGTMLARALTSRTEDGFATPAAVAAIALMVAAMPARWRDIEDAAHGERARSAPSYLLALRAREVASRHGWGELFFAGNELPALVYYSRMRVHFVDVPELKHVELIGALNPPARVRYHDLVLLSSDGAAYTVDNLDREWGKPVETPPPPMPSAPVQEVRNLEP